VDIEFDPEKSQTNSSAWLEYLVDSERASLFAEPIEQTQELIVPVLVIKSEVFSETLTGTRRIRRQTERRLFKDQLTLDQAFRASLSGPPSS
jgi:hypothetical protein